MPVYVVVCILHNLNHGSYNFMMCIIIIYILAYIPGFGSFSLDTWRSANYRLMLSWNEKFSQVYIKGVNWSECCFITKYLRYFLRMLCEQNMYIWSIVLGNFALSLEKTWAYKKMPTLAFLKSYCLWKLVPLRVKITIKRFKTLPWAFILDYLTVYECFESA